MKNRKKIIISLIIAAVMAVTVMTIKISHSAEGSGKITVEAVDLDGQIIRRETLKFSQGDSLTALVEKNFRNVVMNDGMLMSIEDYDTPADWSTYICIYVNNEMSEVGINDIELNDGDVISLRITELVW